MVNNNRRVRNQPLISDEERQRLVSLVDDRFMDSRMARKFTSNRLRGAPILKRMNVGDEAYVNNQALARSHDKLMRESGGRAFSANLRPFRREHGQWQTREVVIRMKGTYAIHEGTYVRNSSVREQTKEHVFRIQNFTTQAEYEDGIKKAIEMMEFMLEISDGDSGYKVFYVAHVSVSDNYSAEEIRSMARSPSTLRLHSSTPVNYSFLERLGVEFDKQPKKYVNCTTKMILDHLVTNGVLKREKWTEEKIASRILDRKITREQLAKRGISIEEAFNFFDQIEKFNVYAFDNFGNVILKSAYGGTDAETGKRRRTTRVPALLFVSHNAHCFTITDPKMITSHINRVKVLNNGSSSMFNNATADAIRAKKNAETVALLQRPYFKIEVDVDFSVNDLGQYEDCNLFVTNRKNLYGLLIKIFKVERHVYNSESLRGNITRINYKDNVTIWANPNLTMVCPKLDLYGDSIMSGKVCKRLGVSFTNQSIGAATKSSSDQYFNPLKESGVEKEDRETITGARRRQFFESRDHTCEICKVQFDAKKLEIDHKIKLSNGGTNEFSNLSLLCKICHDVKTRQECNVFRNDRALSYFNNATVPVFSQPKNAIIHSFLSVSEYADFEKIKTEDGKFIRNELKVNKGVILAGLDIQKCRTNILRYAMKDQRFPVFSALDDPKKFDPENVLHQSIPDGEYYVHSKNICPLKGNSWVTQVTVKYMLANNLLKLKDIKWVIIASGFLPGDYYADFVTEVLGKIIKSKPGTKGYLQEVYVAKQCINSFIGCLGIRSSSVKTKHLFTSLEAAATDAKLRESGAASTNANVGLRANESVKVFPRCFDEKKAKRDKHGCIEKHDYYEVVTESNKQKWDSFYPVFRTILDMEAVELHKIICILKKFGGEIVCCNTDNVVARFSNQKQVDDMTEYASKIFFDAEKKVPKYKRSDSISPNICMREEKASEDVFDYKPHSYTEIEDPGHNDFDKIAEDLVDKLMKGEDFSIEGRAGTGKTFLTGKIMQELIKREIPYLALAPTHVAARQLGKDTLGELFQEDPKNKKKFGGKTIDTGLSSCKHNSFNSLKGYKVCIVDEKSMIKSLFFNALAMWKRSNPDLRIILIGCWYQLRPVKDVSDVFDYENSSVVHEITGGRVLHLTTCRRNKNDKDGRALFEQCKDISKMDIDKFGNKEQIYSIAYYNETVNALNHKNMKRFRDDYVTLEPSKAAKSFKHCQKIYLYVGLPVISVRTQENINLYNSEQWIVESFNDKEVNLHSPDDENEKLVLPVEGFADLVRPAYSVSAYKCQGKTFKFPYSIHDWDRLDDRGRYVCMSRGTKLSDVNIVQTKNMEHVDEKKELLERVLQNRRELVDGKKYTVKVNESTINHILKKRDC